MKKESEKHRRFLERLRAIEKRLALLTGPPQDLSVLEARLSRNRTELKVVRERLALLDQGVVGLTSREASADSELRECLRRNAERVAPALDNKLRAFLSTSVDSQNNVNGRVALLEKEVAQQRAALTELQQCSLQTERTMQKLLKGIDRLLTGNNAQSHSR